MDDSRLDQVKEYFNHFINEYGASPRGSDWNSEASQNIRFDQLIQLFRESKLFSLLDYGCGYGALAGYLIQNGFDVKYYGFDILESAVTLARQIYANTKNCTFLSEKEKLHICDYTVASGIFNYRGNQGFDEWTDYVISTLHGFNDLSLKGFASNFLTKYSDTDKMRAKLYYADPLYLFDYCKRNFSRDVALLHDYEIYDFTILVRKN